MREHMQIKKISFKKLGREVITLVIGSLFYVIGYRCFIEPCRLILGGATGAATLLHALAGVPVGAGIILVNLPLFLWNAMRHGLGGILKVGVGIFSTSLLLDALYFLPPLADIPFLGALLGGVVTALGIAVLLEREYTTGGSELAATLIREKFSLLTVGKIVLLIDTAIVLLSVFLLGETDALFYSILLNLSFAVVLDLVCAQKTANKEKNKFHHRMKNHS